MKMKNRFLWKYFSGVRRSAAERNFNLFMIIIIFWSAAERNFKGEKNDLYLIIFRGKLLFIFIFWSTAGRNFKERKIDLYFMNELYGVPMSTVQWEVVTTTVQCKLDYEALGKREIFKGTVSWSFICGHATKEPKQKPATRRKGSMPKCGCAACRNFEPSLWINNSFHHFLLLHVAM